ncbi:eukaryotic translation initiation factor 3 subunit A-like [Helianthus annuus]|uniref:eukaryotic translation initiation factor 3 subunit A-like n=1 Tax=Helianthus annuus TaxID=4232 RepID=UPI000B9016C0|nr:eukaryotic translation initiation factor 3 subunit A-like [Helianthus annuus]
MTKEDYDQVDPEEMELMDIRCCMASIIRRAQRFMEITSKKCLEGPDMKIGFDKNKNNEQPTRKQIEEGPSKEKRQVVMTLRDRNESSIQNEKSVWDNFYWDKYFDEEEGVRIVIHDDEGYDWSQHDKENGKAKAMVAEIKQSREERHARIRLDEVDDAYKEATQAGRWSKEKECFVDPQGNPTVNPETVDFEALATAIPTVSVWCKGLEEIPRYKEKVEEGIKKVIYASLEKKKKKTIEEIVNESEKLVKEVKKEDEKAEEAVAEKQQVFEEDQNQQENETTVLITEVTIQTDSSDKKAEQQCKKCMETCSTCTKKDEKLKIKDIEFTNVTLENKSEPPRLKQPEEKSRSLAVIYDDEGYDWSKKVLPEEDAVGYAFVAEADPDRWWKVDYARWEIGKLNEPFKEAQRAKRWNEELECYMDPRGNPVADPSKVDFKAVTNLLPRQATFNKRRLSDKAYLPDLEKKIREIAAEEEQKNEEKQKAEKEQKIEEALKEGKEENKEQVQKAKTEESVLEETEVRKIF